MRKFQLSVFPLEYSTPTAALFKLSLIHVILCWAHGMQFRTYIPTTLSKIPHSHLKFPALAAHASSGETAQQSAPYSHEEERALGCSRGLQGALLNEGAACSCHVFLP